MYIYIYIRIHIIHITCIYIYIYIMHMLYFIEKTFHHCFNRQVCGLSWSEELQLLASGGNEGDVWRPGCRYESYFSKNI